MSNRCNIFIAGPGRDVEGGVQFPYPATPSFADIPCTIQGRASEIIDDQRRITQLTTYRIIFAQQYPVSPRDMIQYTDARGASRTIFIESIEDMAGRRSVFTVYATERQ